jgi:tetratricopeptide (TPR) repeat protein
VCLAWLDEAGVDGVSAADLAGARKPKPDLAAFLERQPVEWLVQRLLRVAEADPVLRAEWEALATQSHTDGLDLREFRRQMERALEVSDYMDWEDSAGYEDSAYQVLASIGEMVDEGLAAPAIELVEDALRLLEAAVETVDQEGEMTAVLDAAQELHLQACRAARPDPVALAERLTLWALDSDWDVFADAAEVYADVFGEAGLRRCREIVSAEWEALPAIAPGQPGGYSSRRATLDGLRLSFAETVDEQVEVLRRDLSTSSRFVAIAGALGEAGRFDEALRWLREAQVVFTGPGRVSVDEALADTLRHAGRHEEAAEAEWDCFRSQPGLRSYQRFAEQLRPLAGWDQWRARALELLEHPAEPGSRPASDFVHDYGNSRLVEVLLWEGETDAAWEAAQRGGCTGLGWLQVARARAATHPAESIPVLLRVVDTARSQAANRKAYAAIARQLVELRDWHRRAGSEAAFADYVRRVRADHRSRPAFQDELDIAGLPR